MVKPPFLHSGRTQIAPFGCGYRSPLRRAARRPYRRECALRSGRGPITLCERTWQVAGLPTLDAIRCPDLRSTSSADQPDLRGGDGLARDALARRALTYSVVG